MGKKVVAVGSTARPSALVQGKSAGFPRQPIGVDGGRPGCSGVRREDAGGGREASLAPDPLTPAQRRAGEFDPTCGI